MSEFFIKQPKTNPIFRFLSSLELTIVSLFLTMILVFIATIHQVDWGIFFIKKHYFEAWVVIHDFGNGIKLPVMPGGRLIGFVLMINLVAAHVTRFKWTLSKLGIWLAHIGLIVLLVGGTLTSFFSKEYQMAIQEGGTSNYIQSLSENELAILSDEPDGTQRVVSVSQALLKPSTNISMPQLSKTNEKVALKINTFIPNAALKMAPNRAITQGVGTQITLQELPENKKEVAQNTAAAIIEWDINDKSQGTWLVSTGLGAPQQLQVGDKSYTFFLRPKRTYLPFSLTLDDFRHDKYPGTNIPKNFSSKVQVNHGTQKQSFTIFMNNPLRLQGYTFYQASFGNEDTLSIFQVVKNPAWVFPYISCALVFFGLLIHFVMQLTLFLKRHSKTKETL